MLLHEVLGSGATDEHDGQALVAAEDGRFVGRAELAAHARRIAVLLGASGVSRGARLAIIAEKSPEVIAAFLGCSMAGIVYVPLDPTAAHAYRVRIIAELGIAVVLAREPTAMDDVGGVRTLALPALGEMDDVPSPPAAIFARAETDAAYVLATSGSTGSPKGVELSHLNALAFARWAIQAVALGPGDTVLSVAPFHFDLSVFDIYASLATGARLVLAPAHAATFPGEMIRLIEDHGVTVLYTVPTALRMLVNAGAFDDGAGRSLRTIMYAGEPFPVPALRRLMAALPHVAVHNFFGPTETNVCLAESLAAVPASDDAEVAIGRPASGAAITLADEAGEAVAEGEIGEIVVDGPTVMLGYRTAAGFAPAPRPYRTGDFAVRDGSGAYFFRGRRDDMVKVRGQRIELKAVERVLERVAGVTEAAALVIGDELVATVGGVALDVSALKAACRVNLPAGSMPHRFIVVDGLPRLSNGKLDRRRLAAEAPVEATIPPSHGSRGPDGA